MIYWRKADRLSPDRIDTYNCATIVRGAHTTPSSAGKRVRFEAFSMRKTAENFSNDSSIGARTSL